MEEIKINLDALLRFDNLYSISFEYYHNRPEGQKWVGFLHLQDGKVFAIKFGGSPTEIAEQAEIYLKESYTRNIEV